MAQERGYIDIMSLKNDPTIESWDLKLRRVLRGDRYSDIDRIGSTQDYIESILDESKDKAFAEHCFEDALRRIIVEWHLSKAEEEGYTHRMIEFIIAFTPSGAFEKLLDAMKNEKIIARKHLDRPELKTPNKIILNILLAMARYYPAAPPSKSRDLAFDDYIQLLESLTERPILSGYAVVRLIELRVWRMEGERLEHIVNRDPQSLDTVLNFILSSRSRHRHLSEDLQSIYDSCRSPATFELLKKHLEQRGYISKSAEKGIAILSPDGEIMNLEIADSNLEAYTTEVRWKKELNDIKERLQRGDL